MFQNFLTHLMNLNYKTYTTNELDKNRNYDIVTRYIARPVTHQDISDPVSTILFANYSLFFSKFVCLLRFTISLIDKIITKHKPEVKWCFILLSSVHHSILSVTMVPIYSISFYVKCLICLEVSHADKFDMFLLVFYLCKLYIGRQRLLWQRSQFGWIPG